MPKCPNLRYNLIAFFLLIALFFQLQIASNLHSPVCDEISHIAAGYHYLTYQDFNINRQHPPLVKIYSAILIKIFYPEAKLAEDLSLSANEWDYGLHFLYTNDLNAILQYSRLATISLTILLGYYVFLFARKLWGRPAGLLALTIFCFTPEILAHGHFVTMDLAVTAFGFISIYYLYLYYASSPSNYYFFLACLNLGLALSSKYSAVVFLPLPLIIIFLKVNRLPKISPRYVLVQQLIIYITVLPFTISALYFFHHGITYYFKSIFLVYSDIQRNYQYYFLNQFDSKANHLYFVIAYLIKTPLPFLILLLGAIFYFVYKIKSPSKYTALLFLIIPAFIVFLSTSLVAKNIGLRYVLGATPFLIVLASCVANQINFKKIAILCLLCLLQIKSTLDIAPHYLGYFNQMIGGPAQGFRYLDDSNLDWGQDMKELKKYVEANNLVDFKLLNTWPSLPEYYGIEHRPISDLELLSQPTSGYYIISIQALIRGLLIHRQGQGNTNWLEHYQPIDRIGNSFFVYKF